MEEDIKDLGKLRSSCSVDGLPKLGRAIHPPFSTPALTAEHDCQRKAHK
jgi:hypothetical protein